MTHWSQFQVNGYMFRVFYCNFSYVKKNWDTLDPQHYLRV